MRKLVIVTFFLATCFAKGQNSNHNYLTIPPELKENANAVIRLDNMHISMTSPYKMKVERHLIVTVINKYGDPDAVINVDYNNHTSIKSIKAVVYNAFGFEIKKIKSKDIKDYSATDSGLYSDDRLKYYKYLPLKYPYTIDITTVIERENTAFYPRWIPIHGYYASTQESNFTLDYPKKQFNIKVKENNFKDFNIENLSSGGHIAYKATNLKAFEKEPLNPLFTKFAPNLVLAPNKFNLAGVHGEANNWKEFGQWMYSNLLLGRDQLSESTKSEIKTLVKGIEDPVERARKVYAYMQDKTRYISVQIGIGGWKPMRADEVDKMRYGDCKALVNYTQALLKEADVNAYYTVVYADTKKDIDKNLVAMQGNHAILCLPTKKDTVWLECTTQKHPFGYVGDFTNDRDVLVIKPEGGEIRHTKIYDVKENYQNSKGSYIIDNAGTLTGQLSITSSGVQFENHFKLDSKNQKESVKYYKSYFDNINNLNILKFTNKANKKTSVFKEEISLTASNYARKSGDRLLVTLNAFNKSSYVPKRMTTRLLPIEIDNGYLDKDSVTIHLPKTYKIEALPKSAHVSSTFGTYTTDIAQLNDSTLIYKRTYKVNQGIFPKDEYDNYRKFKKSVARKDNSKLILIKQ
ncbi:MAG: DUF3857 domain-containing protein [Flavobacteriaceae bacterium]